MNVTASTKAYLRLNSQINNRKIIKVFLQYVQTFSFSMVAYLQFFVLNFALVPTKI